MHIGQLIKQELVNQNRLMDWFAEELSCSHTDVYKLLNDASIDTGLLFRISDVLDVDFFKFYSDEFEKAVSGK